MRIEMRGNAALRAVIRTVHDLRQFVAAIDESKVRGDCEVDWGAGHVYVNVVDGTTATWIECGDHVNGDEQWDVLLQTHDHPEDDEPASYDWPTKDKKKRKGAYHRTASEYCYDNGHTFQDWQGVDLCSVCGVRRSDGA